MKKLIHVSWMLCLIAGVTYAQNYQNYRLLGYWAQTEPSGNLIPSDSANITWPAGLGDIFAEAPKSPYLSYNLYVFDTTGGVWYPDHKDVQQVDLTGKVEHRWELDWQNLSWDSVGRADYEYYFNGLVYRQSSWQMNNNQWEALQRSTYTYTPNGKIASSVTEAGAGGINFVNDLRFTIQYDIYDRATSYFYEDWDGSQWVPVLRYRYIYNTIFQTTDDTLHRENYTGGIWVPQYRNISYLNAQWLDTLAIRQDWDGSMFVNAHRQRTVYNNNQAVTDYVTSQWDANGNTWENEDRYMFTYDNYDFQDTRTEMEWDGSAWENNRLLDYDFNADSLLLHATTSYWDNNAWDLDYDWIYYYELKNVTGVENFSLKDFKAYPNPFAEQMQLDFQAKQAGMATVWITDATGRIILSEDIPVSEGTNEHRILSSGIPSGTYIITIWVDGKPISKPIIKG